MSDFQELDLDNLEAPKPGVKPETSDIEIIDEGQEAEPEPAPKPGPREEDDEGEEAPAGESKRPSRSQRLKLQRDAFAQRLAEAEAELQKERTARTAYETRNLEAEKAGMDFYLQSIDTGMKALRAEFNQAFDAGDRDKVFEVQQRMAELAAEKTQLEREKRQNPTKAAPSGPEAPQPTQQTQPATNPQRSSGKANPLAQEWFERNKTWFNTDSIMTAAARAIDQQLVSEGHDPQDVDYFEELDKKLRETFPHKFKPGQSSGKATPTVQNRAAALSPGNKIKVSITGADRQIASRLGVSIEEYARQKARREMAENTSSGYVEIN